MKKSLLLAAAAVLMSTQAFALDMYVIGTNVDGQSWALGTNKMTQTGEGTYEWSGNVLESGFKINDGTWDAAHNIGRGDAGDITLGTAYKYYMGDGSGDIFIKDAALVNNPKIVLDMNAGTITLTGTPGEKEPVDPTDVTFYMIGSNVNGNSWALAQDDAKFEDQGNGIYKWEGEFLGTGFKINDGTWSNGDYNIGSNGGKLSLDTPYPYFANSNSGNIDFNGFTELENPVVVLNINEGTITVSGASSGEVEWYLYNINDMGGDQPGDDTNKFVETDEPGVFVLENFQLYVTAGTFKVASTGWGTELGTNTPEETQITVDNRTVDLVLVQGEGDNLVPYELPEGYYNITFDLNEQTITFADAEDNAVQMVIDLNKKVEYYNLDGTKVNNPEKGIFIQVNDGKAQKVVK